MSGMSASRTKSKRKRLDCGFYCTPSERGAVVLATSVCTFSRFPRFLHMTDIFQDRRMIDPFPVIELISEADGEFASRYGYFRCSV